MLVCQYGPGGNKAEEFATKITKPSKSMQQCAQELGVTDPSSTTSVPLGDCSPPAPSSRQNCESCSDSSQCANGLSCCPFMKKCGPGLCSSPAANCLEMCYDTSCNGGNCNCNCESVGVGKIYSRLEWANLANSNGPGSLIKTCASRALPAVVTATTTTTTLNKPPPNANFGPMLQGQLACMVPFDAFEYSSASSAAAACLAHPNCTGITVKPAVQTGCPYTSLPESYTIRGCAELLLSTSGEASWLKLTTAPKVADALHPFMRSGAMMKKVVLRQWRHYLQGRFEVYDASGADIATQGTVTMDNTSTYGWLALELPEPTAVTRIVYDNAQWKPWQALWAVVELEGEDGVVCGYQRAAGTLVHRMDVGASFIEPMSAHFSNKKYGFTLTGDLPGTKLRFSLLQQVQFACIQEPPCKGIAVEGNSYAMKTNGTLVPTDAAGAFAYVRVQERRYLSASMAVATTNRCCLCKYGSTGWSQSGTCSMCSGSVQTTAAVPLECNQNSFAGNFAMSTSSVCGAKCAKVVRD